jgi:predicted dehydrogenase
MSRQDPELNVGLIGSGAVAERRAAAIRSVPGLRLVAVAETTDAFREQGHTFAQRHDCTFVGAWDALVTRDELDLIIVATINELHLPLGLAALQHGKHVLIEKPLARAVQEGQALLAAAARHQRRLKTGFNHRHHPWVQHVAGWLREGRLGRPCWARALIGHAGMLGSGRPNFAKSWFVDPEKAGGGTLLDNGVHTHDLVRWHLHCDFAEVVGWVTTATSGQVEDNASGVFKTAEASCLYVHQSSWTHHGDYCVLEYAGTEGNIHLNYGLGSATHVRPGGGRERVYETMAFDLKAPDRSWALELVEFRNAIWEDREPQGNGQDGLEALVMSEALVRASQTGQGVCLADVRHTTPVAGAAPV